MAAWCRVATRVAEPWGVATAASELCTEAAVPRHVEDPDGEREARGDPQIRVVFTNGSFGLGSVYTQL